MGRPKWTEEQRQRESGNRRLTEEQKAERRELRELTARRGRYDFGSCPKCKQETLVAYYRFVDPLAHEMQLDIQCLNCKWEWAGMATSLRPGCKEQTYPPAWIHLDATRHVMRKEMEKIYPDPPEEEG
jgi:hypothetical protein